MSASNLRLHTQTLIFQEFLRFKFKNFVIPHFVSSHLKLAFLKFKMSMGLKLLH